MTARNPLRRARSRRVILLGSTGSIGTNTLATINHLRAIGAGEFPVVGLAAGSNAEVLADQARDHRVEHVAVADASHAGTLSEFGHVYAGADAALELIDAVAQPGDLVVGAMVGAAGIPATIHAIEIGCDIALANKETLVAAGSIVMPLVRKHEVDLTPIDSEHSAIAQCLRSGRDVEEVERLVITASGGPFRTWTASRMQSATVEDALNHPKWDMGRKNTIDSASLMNKGLEIIEAHVLFGLPADRIDAIVHPQAIVHSFVEFIDGSVIAQLSPPDMKMPIQYALTAPDRIDGCADRMDWQTLRSLEFEPADRHRFPALQLAYDAINAGGNAAAVLNAANEIAVDAFLNQRIGFMDIARVVGDAMQSVPNTPVRTIDDILAADRTARDAATDQINRLAQTPARV